MIIKFTDFSDGVHEFQLINTVEEVGLSPEFFGNIDLECKMDKFTHQIVISCDAETNAHFVCDRCNKEFDTTIEFSFQSIYMYTNEHINEDSEEENIHYLSPEKTTIDLTPDVKELSLLALPMKKLCGDECKGLCPKCGKDLNQGQCECTDDEVDPVWEPLLKLKDKLNN